MATLANRINQLIDESAAKTGVKRGAVIAAVAKHCGIAGPLIGRAELTTFPDGSRQFDGLILNTG